MNERIAETAPQARHVCYFFMESKGRVLTLSSLGAGKKTVNNSVELASGEANLGGREMKVRLLVRR